jgi:hypothetical protein
LKRLVVCVLSLLFTTTAVAQASTVKAPRVYRETRLMLDRPAQTPVQTPDPIEEARLALRAEVEAQANIDGICAQWAGLAFDVGWPVREIPKLLRIIYRESRCLPDACGVPDRPDLRVCRDWGLTQINDYSWKKTIRGQGLEMRDMWNPELNLRFALWLFNYSEDRNGDGWQPWRMQH